MKPIIVTIAPEGDGAFRVLRLVNCIDFSPGDVVSADKVREWCCRPLVTVNVVPPRITPTRQFTTAVVTNRDKRQAVERALEEHPGASDREIARITGVSHPFVSKVRAELSAPALLVLPDVR